MPFALGVIGGLGVPELALIVVMLVLLFGAGRIPQIARGLGEGIRNFKGGIKEPPRIEGDRDREGSPGDGDAGDRPRS
jgi:sec-independent protein translocase protein TatA